MLQIDEQTTPQQVFDYVTAFVFKQGVQSTIVKRSIEDEETTVCAYRGANGTMCAVGCLIPDEVYESIIEDETLHALLAYADLDAYPELNAAIQKFGPFEALLCDLQVAHDSTAFKGESQAQLWDRRFARVAKTHGLEYKGIPC